MHVYPPSEDTLLLLDHVRCRGDVLEMGSGNGLIAIECAKKGAKVTAVDIDEQAINHIKKIAEMENVEILTIRSNLFENVRGKYDVIIFNPPYLPGDAENMIDLQWAGGGEFGDETILQFLKDAKNYLKDKGEIFMVLSSFNRLHKIKMRGYEMEKLGEMKLAFHSIYVYRLVPA